MNSPLSSLGNRLVFLGSLLICSLLLLAACSAKPAQTLPTATDQPTAELLDGVQLYQQNCSPCHGPLESSEKLGRSVSRIHYAIHHFASMSRFKSLSILQLKALSEALNQP